MASLHPQDSTDGNTGTSTHRSASPRVPNSSTSRSAQQLAHGVNSLITSHKNALAQHNNVTSNNSSIPQLSHHTNGVKSGKTPSSNYSTGHVKLIDMRIGVVVCRRALTLNLSIVKNVFP